MYQIKSIDMKTRTKTITLSDSLIKAVEKKAKEENRSFSNMVEVILLNNVKSQES